MSGQFWIIQTLNSLAFGGLLLLGGRIADYQGRKRMFIIGLIGFAAASFIGGLSTTQGMLFGARALQGAFGALLAGLLWRLESPLTTVLLAPFGGYAFNLAAITAAIVLNPHAHADARKRYTAAMWAGLFYIVMGLLGGAVAGLLAAFPAALITPMLVLVFGINPAAKGDQIMNGALDDGSGMAVMLAMAEAFAKMPVRPKRSILFLSPTAEEATMDRECLLQIGDFHQWGHDTAPPVFQQAT